MTADTIHRLARGFAAEWLRPSDPDHATEAMVDTLSTAMLAFYAVARGVKPSAAAALDAARPAELAAIIRERDEALAAWRELRLWAEENGWLEKATRSNKASEMLAALDAAPRLQKLDLEPIKARCDAATAGPWEAMEAGNCEMEDGRLTAIARVDGLPRPWNPVWVGWRVATNYFKTFLRSRDAEFVAHAREDIPALIAEIERRLAADGGAVARPPENVEDDPARSPSTATPRGAGSTARADGDT